MMRFAFRTAARLIAAAVLAGALGACTAGSPKETDLAGPGVVDAAQGDSSSVIVIERGWHTDVALPAAALTGPVATLRRDFPGATFMVFGFGDRGYLMTRHVSVISMVAALFPGPGVMLVTGLRATPAQAFGADNVALLHLTCMQRRALVDYVSRSFTVREDGAIERLADGPYAGSAFYATDQIYDLLHNCNRWTADALASAGLPVTTIGVALSNQVMGPARRLADPRLSNGPNSAQSTAQEPCVS